MNEFERRWRECVRVARGAEREEARGVGPVPEAPVGGWLGGGDAGPTTGGEEGRELSEWWGWYGTRGVAVAAAALVLCLIFLARDRAAGPAWRPGVEDAVAEVLWRL